MAVSPNERDDLVAQLRGELTEFREQLATALGTIERLTEQSKKNSTNSHLPPSSDGPGAESRGVRKPKKKKSGRKRGGQKGRHGAHRQLLPPKRVDEFIHLFPEACEGCARPLSQVQDIDARRCQCVELLAGGPRVTQWLLACGRLSVWAQHPGAL